MTAQWPVTNSFHLSESVDVRVPAEDNEELSVVDELALMLFHRVPCFGRVIVEEGVLRHCGEEDIEYTDVLPKEIDWIKCEDFDFLLLFVGFLAEEFNSAMNVDVVWMAANAVFVEGEDAFDWVVFRVGWEDGGHLLDRPDVVFSVEDVWVVEDGAAVETKKFTAFF